MTVEFKRNDKPINVMIFRNDYEDKIFYKLGMSKKLADGSFENGYMDCQFRKEVEIQNQTRIHPTEAWLSFYKNKNGITVPYVFINAFKYSDDEMTEEVDIDDLDNLLD